MKNKWLLSVKVIDTVKYLKFKQIYYRIYYKLFKPKLRSYNVTDSRNWEWKGPALNNQSIINHTEVIFLNEKGSIVDKADWNSDVKTKLWLYNLHYFDDLCAIGADKRAEFHNHFINKWIEHNPPFIGNGWEPYPLSLRLVNWVKWCSVQSEVSSSLLDCILTQSDALSQQLEYHILGNHLFANAKALIFVGAYLKGVDADGYLKLGLKVLDEELSEQFLDDGAHFELSPMYHQILLWDLLELIDLAKTSQVSTLQTYLPRFRKVALKALAWLSTMVHTDGEVSFFNDSCIGIAKTPEQIFLYAETLGLDVVKNNNTLVTFKESGYSRVSFEKYSLIYDHANVGPDYLPGHAHADTLSFEMSIGQQRVFVNSGTSLYGTSSERLRQRQTPAHNTVSVDGFDSSQVWSGFRVAKRAYAKLHKATNVQDKVCIVASHDGYKKQSPNLTHTRELACTSECVKIKDTLLRGTSACFHLHIHPELLAMHLSKYELKIMQGEDIICNFKSSAPIQIKESTWHPEFGVSVANQKIEIAFSETYLETEITNIKSVT